MPTEVSWSAELGGCGHCSRGRVGDQMEPGLVVLLPLELVAMVVVGLFMVWQR